MGLDDGRLPAHGLAQIFVVRNMAEIRRADPEKAVTNPRELVVELPAVRRAIDHVRDHFDAAVRVGGGTRL